MTSKSLDRTKNNFDFFRFFAATLVIFSHSYPLLLGVDHGDPFFSWNNSMISLGTIGVAIFFTISGYLISQSWENTNNMKSYFIKRVLRIFPGFFVVVLLTSFVIAPVLLKIDIFDYMKNFNWEPFFSKLIFLQQYNIPNLFASNPYPNAVNGSLWTLCIEFFCYILIAFLGIIFFYKLLGKMKKETGLLFLIISFSSILLFIKLVYSFDWYEGFFERVIFLSVFFLIGAFYFYHQELIVFRPALIITLVGLCVILIKSPLFVTCCFIAIPYIVLSIGFLQIPYLNKFGLYGDFSYGLYIYAFVIQQILSLYLHNDLTVITLFLLSFILVLPIAILSWYLIEKPALSFKNKLS